jgi:Right handed beta helix region
MNRPRFYAHCLVAVVAACLASQFGWSADCIHSGDETAINAALSGPHARAALCAGATFRLSHQIVLSGDGQELYTENSPDGDSRAHIVVADANLSTAIFSRASNVFVHHVIVDGARARYGRDPRGSALIELGGEVSGVRVDHIRAFDPRGWSILHVFQGNNNCSGARITFNELGPSGHPNGEWADGISFACRDGFIQHNTITDASDGAIVLFGAPGTLVEHNIIATQSNILLGGVNMVDFGAFGGDSSGTIVRNNRLEARGGFIKIGIAAGPAVWGSKSGHLNRGAVITGNTFSGDNFGFGIAVDGVVDFTIEGNKATGRFGGVRTKRCWPGTSPPGHAFVRNSQSSSGTFQKDFEEGVLGYAICIKKSADDPD